MLIQLLIVFTGLTAVYLSQSKEYAKYACFFGLAGQPLWFYTTWINELNLFQNDSKDKSKNSVMNMRN